MVPFVLENVIGVMLPQVQNRIGIGIVLQYSCLFQQIMCVETTSVNVLSQLRGRLDPFHIAQVLLNLLAGTVVGSIGRKE